MEVLIEWDDLVDDCQRLIMFTFLDLPSRFSLALACRRWYAKYWNYHDVTCGEFIDSCATLGYLDLLQYAHELGAYVGVNAFDAALEHVQIKVMLWIDKLFPEEKLFVKHRIRIGTAATYHGCRELLDLVLTLNSFSMIEIRRFVFEAAKGGQDEIVKEFLKKYPRDELWSRSERENLICEAARGGHLKSALALCQTESHPTDDEMRSIARGSMAGSQTEILEYCLNSAVQFPYYLTKDGMKSLAFFKALTKAFPILLDSLALPALLIEYPNYEIVVYLIDNGYSIHRFRVEDFMRPFRVLNTCTPSHLVHCADQIHKLLKLFSSKHNLKLKGVDLKSWQTFEQWQWFTCNSTLCKENEFWLGTWFSFYVDTCWDLDVRIVGHFIQNWPSIHILRQWLPSLAFLRKGIKALEAFFSNVSDAQLKDLIDPRHSILVKVADKAIKPWTWYIDKTGFKALPRYYHLIEVIKLFISHGFVLGQPAVERFNQIQNTFFQNEFLKLVSVYVL